MPQLSAKPMTRVKNIPDPKIQSYKKTMKELEWEKERRLVGEDGGSVRNAGACHLALLLLQSLRLRSYWSTSMCIHPVLLLASLTFVTSLSFLCRLRSSLPDKVSPSYRRSP